MVNQQESTTYLLLENIVNSSVIDNHNVFYTRIPYFYSIHDGVIHNKSVDQLFKIADKVSAELKISMVSEKELSIILYSDINEAYCMHPVQKVGQVYKINTSVLLAKNIHNTYVN